MARNAVPDSLLLRRWRYALRPEPAKNVCQKPSERHDVDSVVQMSKTKREKTVENALNRTDVPQYGVLQQSDNVELRVKKASEIYIITPMKRIVNEERSIHSPDEEH